MSDAVIILLFCKRKERQRVSKSSQATKRKIIIATEGGGLGEVGVG